MSSTPLLAGIAQHTIKTDRLEVAYLEVGSGSVPVVLIHGNVSSSAFFQDFMLALAATGRYHVYAPDMRGYGDSETMAVDATHGVRDFSDDLDAFVRAINLPSFHLLGWSLGGNVVMQYAIDYPGAIRSLLLGIPQLSFRFRWDKRCHRHTYLARFRGQWRRNSQSRIRAAARPRVTAEIASFRHAPP